MYLNSLDYPFNPSCLDPAASCFYIHIKMQQMSLEQSSAIESYLFEMLLCFLCPLARQPDSDGDQHHTNIPSGLSQLHVQTAFQPAAWFECRTVHRLLSHNVQGC